MKSRFKIKSGKLSTSLEAKIDEIKKFCEEAFPGGTICWAAPFGHIVYVYDGIGYDIEGELDYEEYELFIPINCLGDVIKVFKHNGETFNATKEDLKKIYQKFCSSI